MIIRIVILLIIFINLIKSNETTITLKKDHNLYDLITLLNNNKNTFNDWGNITITNENIIKFFDIFEPWLLNPININEHYNNYDNFHNKNNDNNDNNKVSINCKNTRYSNVLTGNLLKKPRILIDFIPFGYDIDKLFIRFYESYNIIDIYIIYECPFTLIGDSI